MFQLVSSAEPDRDGRKLDHLSDELFEMKGELECPGRNQRPAENGNR